MAGPESLRILVLSDIHAHMREPGTDNTASISFHGSGARANALFAAVPIAIEKAVSGPVDAVVCAGDLTDQCDATALTAVWSKLCALADELKAPLIATAGNHDHDRSGGQPQEHLKALDPPFPMRTAQSRSDFFADDVAHMIVKGRLFITVNSASLTAVNKQDSPQNWCGQLTDTAKRAISRIIEDNREHAPGVLVVHHHPVQLPYVDLDERSLIANVQPMLDVLEESGPWLIIHGHKHRPWVQYAPGGGDSAVLFSAGSFSAPLDGVLAEVTRNQFYVLEIETAPTAGRESLSLAGRFWAWTHVPYGGDPWALVGGGPGLPARGGFGARESPTAIARLIADHVRTTKESQPWTSLVAWREILAHVTPSDWRRISQEVAATSEDVRIINDEDGHVSVAEYRELR